MVQLENIKKLYLSDIQFSLKLIRIDKNAINLPIFLLKNRIVTSRISQKRQNFDVVDSNSVAGGDITMEFHKIPVFLQLFSRTFR
jgi:hypothetical protein